MYLSRETPNPKGSIIYELDNHHISISRDVVFYEDIFPLKENNLDKTPERESIKENNIELTYSDDTNIILEDNSDPSVIPQIPQINPNTIPSETPQIQQINPNTEDILILNDELNQRRYPKRQTKPFTRLDAYLCSFATSNGRSKGIAYPMHDYY